MGAPSIPKSVESALILGGNGLLGSYLSDFLRGKGFAVDVTSRRKNDTNKIYLDISASTPHFSIVGPRYDVAILCAGFGSVVACELDPDLSYSVNVRGRASVTNALVEAGTRVIAFSSDAVFSGEFPNKDFLAKPDPQSVYGRHMVEFERVALALGPLVSVIRLGKVFHPELPLLHDWIGSIVAGNNILAAVDLKTAPISLDFVAHAVDTVVDENVKGLVHASAKQDFAWSEIAKILARALGKDDSCVSEVLASDLVPPLPRKLHAALAESHRFEIQGAQGKVALSESIQGAVEIFFAENRNGLEN